MVLQQITSMKQWNLYAKGHVRVNNKTYKEQELNFGEVAIEGFLKQKQYKIQLWGLNQVQTWDVWRSLLSFAV